MTIKLTPELEQVLIDRATQQGTPPELLALAVLQERLLPATVAEPDTAEGTLADFLAEFIGTLHSGEQIPGGARMSEKSGEKFAAGLVRKRQTGRL